MRQKSEKKKVMVFIFYDLLYPWSFFFFSFSCVCRKLRCTLNAFVALGKGGFNDFILTILIKTEYNILLTNGADYQYQRELVLLFS